MKTRLLLVLFVSGLALSGCSAFRKCTGASCAADAAISKEVTARLAHYPALEADSVRVQTLHQVVYLTGMVDTDVERLLAVSLAGEADGVKRVVDSISVNNVPR